MRCWGFPSFRLGRALHRPFSHGANREGHERWIGHSMIEPAQGQAVIWYHSSVVDYIGIYWKRCEWMTLRVDRWLVQQSTPIVGPLPLYLERCCLVCHLKNQNPILSDSFPLPIFLFFCWVCLSDAGFAHRKKGLLEPNRVMRLRACHSNSSILCVLPLEVTQFRHWKD